MMGRAAAICMLLAVVTHLTISGALLTYLGIPYISEGGSPIWKLHPASYFAYLAALLSLLSCLAARPGAMGSLWKPRDLIFSGLLFLLCIAYQALMTGTGNPIVIMDTFLPSAMIALALALARSSDVRRVHTALTLGLASNAAIALLECVTQTHPITPMIDGRLTYEVGPEFRATALYDHPLTGATASVVGLLMPLSQANRRMCLGYRALLGASLLAFGGRFATLTAVLALILLQGDRLWVALIQRRPSALRLLSTTCAGVAAGVAGCSILLLAGFGGRLVNHSYWDPSAQVRLAQWRLLGLLDTSQWLFGCARQDLLVDVHMLDLSYGVEVIESFWLLMFASLGVFGFPVFLWGFFKLLQWCWSRGDRHSKVMIITVMAILSTSNSLGRKSPSLLIMVAAIASAGPFVARSSLPLNLPNGGVAGVILRSTCHAY